MLLPLYIYILYIYIYISRIQSRILIKYAVKVNFEVTGISESVLTFNNVFNIHSIQNKEWSISVEKFLLAILRVQSIVWKLAVCSL